MDSLHEKYENLKNILRSCQGVAVAFSSGVDSTLLLKTARNVLGDRVIAITAVSRSFPQRERAEAAAFCKENNIRQFFVDSEELSIEGFRRNPPDRCYLCKRELFGKIRKLASEQGFSVVAEGSNMDDLSDYRPGLRAIEELGIRSPLREAGLYKEEIRVLSKELSLPTWKKPSFACLASRFVYGETITAEKLGMVEKAEQFLMDRGFSQLRVRIHGDLARIEVEPSEIPRLTDPGMSSQVSLYLKSLGFSYVTVDLQGYRTGSMNEVLFRSGTGV
ncbi:MAG: ATP-dependent sacrificial sulfur transferase LarE [Blautia sp.]|nr:ATP-dependent sacrificial sulfur transferase LarE [Blautia sp.]